MKLWNEGALLYLIPSRPALVVSYPGYEIGISFLGLTSFLLTRGDHGLGSLKLAWSLGFGRFELRYPSICGARS